jgi:hypothetical protein
LPFPKQIFNEDYLAEPNSFGDMLKENRAQCRTADQGFGSDNWSNRGCGSGGWIHGIREMEKA